MEHVVPTSDFSLLILLITIFTSKTIREKGKNQKFKFSTIGML